MHLKKFVVEKGILQDDLLYDARENRENKVNHQFVHQTERADHIETGD